jgi:hypothetical protein
MLDTPCLRRRIKTFLLCFGIRLVRPSSPKAAASSEAKLFAARF